MFLRSIKPDHDSTIMFTKLIAIRRRRHFVAFYAPIKSFDRLSICMAIHLPEFEGV